MMASYTIAHLKLAMTLKKSGVEKFGKRLGVYLSNTLDDAHNIPLTSSLFGVVDSIAQESRLASEVKNNTPIMVVMGNPPYSVVSQNLHYTDNQVYKVEPGGLKKLKEDKNFLDDDYVKFIRFAESMVEKNGEGIIGMITNHGYIDNLSFRGMRWHLRNTFDVIYVLDLHGNSTKKETTLDGSEDKNVFDIKTGVSIIFGVKKKSDPKTKVLATVFTADIYGKRAKKFAELSNSSIEEIHWNKLPEISDVWKIEGEGKSEYMKGFSLSDLFPKNTTGVFTLGDGFIIANSKTELEQRVENLLDTDVSEAQLTEKYSLGKNYARWVLENKSSGKISDYKNALTALNYRPFDRRYTSLTTSLVWRPRISIMKHLLHSENLALLFSRQGGAANPSSFDTVFISNSSVDLNFFRRGGEVVCPLYLYEGGEKIANLDNDIVSTIEKTVGKTTPEDILDYVYGHLHSPTYRTKYKEFLNSDFPRVPYPENREYFNTLVEIGRQLRELHLLIHPSIQARITTFPETGTDIVGKTSYKNNRVYINDAQYWDGVPKEVWEFYVGGYQPAQKYLKDRKDKKLTTAEFENYEKMIVSLAETIKVMKEIDALLT